MTIEERIEQVNEMEGTEEEVFNAYIDILCDIEEFEQFHKFELIWFKRHMEYENEYDDGYEVIDYKNPQISDFFTEEHRKEIKNCIVDFVEDVESWEAEKRSMMLWGY